MSVLELLDQIRQLTPEEQAAFAELFHRWEQTGDDATAQSIPQRVSLPDFAARRRRIFGAGTLNENPVTSARREERW